MTMHELNNKYNNRKFDYMNPELEIGDVVQDAHQVSFDFEDEDSQGWRYRISGVIQLDDEGRWVGVTPDFVSVCSDGEWETVLDDGELFATILDERLSEVTPKPIPVPSAMAVKVIHKKRWEGDPFECLQSTTVAEAEVEGPDMTIYVTVVRGETNEWSVAAYSELARYRAELDGEGDIDVPETGYSSISYDSWEEALGSPWGEVFLKIRQRLFGGRGRK